MNTPPAPIPLDAELLSRTPPEVIELLLRLLAENQALREENRLLREEVAKLRARVEELEAKLNENSSNSNKPPSSDSPFDKRPDAAAKTKKPRKRKGARQQCLRPTELIELRPERCSCGCHIFEEQEAYYIHQVIELPEIQMNVRHIILYRGDCTHCGKTCKAVIPSHMRTGFGPRLSALIMEFCGTHGDSRRAAQDFLFSVLGIRISQGAIQRVLERVSQAIEPHYGAIKEAVQSFDVNHADETVWKQRKTLEWLWLLCGTQAAYFMIHASRSRKAFQALIGDWHGLLVSDDYGVYTNWEHGRQTCLAHIIRKAKGLSERKSPSINKAGAWILKELRLLCRMAKHPPSNGEWNAHCARMQRLINLHKDRDDEVGRLVRRIDEEMEHLRMFLHYHGVEPTNNHAERTLRFAVLWRKRSFGTRVEKGDRLVERILSLRQTCRLQAKRMFPVLAQAMSAFLQGIPPDISWIRAIGGATP